MIIQFTVGNYRSFHELQSLNFRPTGLVSENKKVDGCNIIEKEGNSFLKILGIYGPNASGKSNLIKAIIFFKEMVASSLESENLLRYEHNPFRLSSRTHEDSGYFQMVLFLKGKKYRYGFALDKQANIQAEWLFGPAEKNETFYFTRKGSDIDVNEERFKEGSQLPYSRLRADTLFLTFCSSYDGEISSIIKDFLSEHVIVEGQPFFNRMQIIGMGSDRELTNRLIKRGDKGLILSWMSEAGLSFDDIELQDIEFNKKKYGSYILLTKNVYDDKGEIIDKVVMNLDNDESQGTKKFFSYIGGLWEVFNNGGVFISDEIDSNFHPSLLMKVIRLFQNTSINKAGAQLLFSSHDVNLMDPNIMRRDQFYFTEKNQGSETRLYSLADLKGIRNNADFARQYLAGYYGALPKLGDFIASSEYTGEAENPELID